MGDDTYYVDSTFDRVVEYSSSEGVDIVYASANYTLSNGLEHLTLIGSLAINGTGNNERNIIVGNDAANVLDGKEGSDTIYGNAGNDTLYGGNDKDTLIGGTGADLLNGGDGIDIASYITSMTSIVANLATPQENTGDAQGDVFLLIENLEGSEYGDRLTGDSQKNYLWGRGGEDFLDGLGGDDTLEGGIGSDTYNVDSINDAIVEHLNQGFDSVNASVSYTLRLNVENLTLLEGTAALNGTGNDLGNIIIGNSANNVLDGGAGSDFLYGNFGTDTLIGGDGDDWIFGGRGNDLLTGGIGSDMFAYTNVTDAGDMIMDFTIGSDKIVLTEMVKNSGWRSSNLLADGFLMCRQANAGTTALMIDPDGSLGRAFRPAPFVLLNNVSAVALNNLSNFVA